MGGDIPALFRDFGIIVVNAFDTQEASGLLGRTGVGLAALLDLWGCPLRREVATLKDHMKHADWRLRPLTEVMLRYATLDVHYLVSLYKLQVRELLLSSYSSMAKGNRVGSKGHDGSSQGKGGDKKNSHYQKDKENSLLSKVTIDEPANSLKKDATKTNRDDLEGNSEIEDDGEMTGGLEVTVDSLAVHQQLDQSDTLGDCDVEEEDEEGQEVWGLDPAPDAGVNMKSKTNHLSDRFEDEGDGGDEDDLEGDDGGGALVSHSSYGSDGSLLLILIQ
jgi:3'-5' exonuclease